MIALQDTPIECVEIDFENARLPGYFVSGGDGARPTVIALGGFDSTMEELYGWIGAVAPAHSWNCLMFEGPGQWGALKTNPGLTFRPDYEKRQYWWNATMKTPAKKISAPIFFGLQFMLHRSGSAN